MVSEMAQHVKKTAEQSDDVIPRTYMVEGEANYCKMFSDLSTLTGMEVSSFSPPPQTDS